ncbi:hypothetical protein K493DRAFT_288269 [Basidiobolus meristosporus CBS 931.73]|uniref:GmrSD restriction endonucleases N-terminal domain-containing protein n=1 Tax=Basidiobolus meristosporus CBS 931.73 TaxID=1314790 RepID=A0A1Y1XX31_9FUNG|nr:hypothetical protein K493DRAFT_288269 [Basidiobolus meristosporus CBS 931.73]|eukprot:ORX90283.1 hypothetical protein K493DRAFT_288269 [Basidiobolus meristosporus CBS 931.73]
MSSLPAVEALNKPRNVTHQLYKLHEMMENNLIDLCPEFQRDVVWPEKRMSYLIDSILKNFYVPPVIFSCKRLPDGRLLKVCIDGKQRLSSIRRFMNNDIPHIDPNSPVAVKRWFNEDPTVSRRHVLTEREREDFRYSELICVEYYGLTMEQENEIFSRVQMGVALTAAEKLQAVATPMAQFVRTLLDEYPRVLEIMDNRRARPYLLAAQTIHMIYYEPMKMQSSSSNIEKFLRTNITIDPDFRARCTDTFRKYSKLVEDSLDIFFVPTIMAPIEFVIFGYIIARYPERTLEQLKNDLLQMRKHVRSEFIDIRFNTITYNHMMEFVLNIDNYDYEQVHLVSRKHRMPAHMKNRVPPTKRSRDHSDDMEPESPPRPQSHKKPQTAVRTPGRIAPPDENVVVKSEPRGESSEDDVQFIKEEPRDNEATSRLINPPRQLFSAGSAPNRNSRR